ncbi:MAG: lipopolysaccharide heptosyltransferase I [Azospirillaceae bacterium]
MTRVLLVKTSSLGDLIHTLPAITDARRAIPDLALDWLIEEGLAAVAGWHPAVAQVIPVAFRKWWQHRAKGLFGGHALAFRRRLRRQRYDHVVDAQGLMKSALMAMQARGTRHGFDRHSIREPLAARFYHARHGVPRDLHAIARVRRLMALSLGYEPPGAPPEFGIDRARLPASPLAGSRYLTFVFGTAWPAKQWPIANWRALAALAAERDLEVALHGHGAAETAMAEAIAKGLDNAHVFRDLGLDGVAGLIAGGAGTVGVDTGLTHLSAALGLPGVGLYGPTSPVLTGAVGPAHVNLTGSTDLDPERHHRGGRDGASPPPDAPSEAVFAALMARLEPAGG